MKFLTLLFVVFSTRWALGQTPCANSRFFQDNIKVNTQTNSSGGCYLSVTPFRIKNLTYRDYLFDDRGLLMVFVSFGPGPVSSTTGAREFYFFPRQYKIPTYLKVNDAIVVTHPSGTLFRFPLATGDLAEISPGVATVNSFFDPSQNGGVEILQFQGIMLDAGFDMGTTASSNPQRFSLFKDESGNSCQVRNKELFNYFGQGDVEFKFPTDPPLRKFLEKKCPQLNLTLLASE